MTPVHCVGVHIDRNTAYKEIENQRGEYATKTNTE